MDAMVMQDVDPVESLRGRSSSRGRFLEYPKKGRGTRVAAARPGWLRERNALRAKAMRLQLESRDKPPRRRDLCNIRRTTARFQGVERHAKVQTRGDDQTRGGPRGRVQRLVPERSPARRR